MLDWVGILWPKKVEFAVHPHRPYRIGIWNCRFGPQLCPVIGHDFRGLVPKAFGEMEWRWPMEAVNPMEECVEDRKVIQLGVFRSEAEKIKYLKFFLCNFTCFSICCSSSQAAASTPSMSSSIIADEPGAKLSLLFARLMAKIEAREETSAVPRPDIFVVEEGATL
jgi:hypothetical protein